VEILNCLHKTKLGKDISKNCVTEMLSKASSVNKSISTVSKFCKIDDCIADLHKSREINLEDQVKQQILDDCQGVKQIFIDIYKGCGNKPDPAFLAELEKDYSGSFKDRIDECQNRVQGLLSQIERCETYISNEDENVANTTSRTIKIPSSPPKKKKWW